MSHGCPAPGCVEQVPFERLACRRHWYAIPKPLRDEVWTSYRRHGQGSAEHSAAIGAAISFLRGEAR